MKCSFLISILTLSILVFSCKTGVDEKLNADVSDIDIKDVKIQRYGKDLFSIDPDNIVSELRSLSGKYYFFLGGNIDDTLNLIQIKSYITDPNLKELASVTFNKYQDLSDLESSLTTAFKHYKYYYPDYNIPQVYTYISGLDFEYPVRFVDTVMIIALDMYLGHDAKFYKQIGLPQYKTDFLDKDFIVVDCMQELAKKNISFDPSNKTLLDQMINRGKALYFLDAMLPGIADANKIKYTPEQEKWCKENESNIWSMFIDQQLLYSKDLPVVNKYINDGPFTNGLSKESPSRLGDWIGWQIVRSFMSNNDISLQQLMQLKDSQKILKESLYKPRS